MASSCRPSKVSGIDAAKRFLQTVCREPLILIAVLALAGPARAEIQFSRSFAAGDGPKAVVADVDGDGVPDIISANRNSDDVSVLLGNGDGSF